MHFYICKIYLSINLFCRSITIATNKFRMFLTTNLDLDIKRRLPTRQLRNRHCIDRIILLISLAHKTGNKPDLP